jgi:nitrogen PTS system EIIA component
MFDTEGRRGPEHASLSAAVARGNICYELSGVDRESLLSAVVKALRLPDKIDRAEFYEALVAREKSATTAIGDGIAIPHVRHPIVMHIGDPIVAIMFPKEPVDFGAPDNKPVNCLFIIISPTVRTHLQLLSGLVFSLKTPSFKSLIERKASPEEIEGELRRIESTAGDHIKPEEKSAES